MQGRGIKKTVVMDIHDILKTEFTAYLKTIGYAPSTVYTSSRHVRDFIYWLKLKHITKLNDIDSNTITEYLYHLQKRKNKKQSGSLSCNYIQGNINSLKRLSHYLVQSGRTIIEIPDLQLAQKSNSITILTPQEIQSLYRACSNNMLGIRDRAILSLYYGCGLRRSEGLALNLSDVNLRDRVIYIKNTKTYYDRYVPMSSQVAEDLTNYIYCSRENMQSFKKQKTDALLLSMRSKRMCGNTLIERLNKLKQAAGIDKPAGLHTLRHSIATHLLRSGMELEEVGVFLGHRSLESTQIYTHL